MSSVSQLGSWDLFFNYGDNDLDLEIESDAMMLVLQPPRTLYYNNLESCGIVENYPNAVSLQVILRYNIAKAFAFRNRMVTDGSKGTKDRRIAVSQNSIEFETVGEGELNVSVLYIPFYNYNAYNTVNSIMPGLT